jgi:cell division protein FtsZ
MKSIVEEVLAKFGPEEEEVAEATKFRAVAPVDAELERVLASLKTNIKVIGCGGAGANTIHRCLEAGIVGAEFYAANTDAQHLLLVHAPHKILLGKRVTKGLGAGAIPQVGEEAAKEAEDEIRSALSGADLVFCTCGLGGGTGTGGLPVVASIAKEIGALTIAVCTLPFKSEGVVRMENAEYGLERLRNIADTVIVIPNDKLLEIAPRLTVSAAFKVADEVLMKAIKGITEIIQKPGLINLDFNDIKTIMKGGGVAMIGMGEGDSEDRATDAVTEALNSPLLEVDISNATGALVNVFGGLDMTISEAQRAMELVQNKINPSARIIWGAAIDPTQEHKISVMVILTGVKSKQIMGVLDRTVTKGPKVGIDWIK